MGDKFVFLIRSSNTLSFVLSYNRPGQVKIVIVEAMKIRRYFDDIVQLKPGCRQIGRHLQGLFGDPEVGQSALADLLGRVRTFRNHRVAVVHGDDLLDLTQAEQSWCYPRPLYTGCCLAGSHHRSGLLE